MHARTFSCLEGLDRDAFDSAWVLMDALQRTMEDSRMRAKAAEFNYTDGAFAKRVHDNVVGREFNGESVRECFRCISNFNANFKYASYNHEHEYF